MGLQDMGQWKKGHGWLLAHGVDGEKLSRSGGVSRMGRFDYLMSRRGKAREIRASQSSLCVTKARELPTNYR